MPTEYVRLRKGQADWNDGDGGRKGQDAHQKRHAARVPRSAAIYS